MFFDRFFKKNKPDNIAPYDESIPEEEVVSQVIAEHIADNLKVSVGPVQSEAVIPPFKGDYAKAIFLWANSKKASLRDDDDYPRYILYECGIRKPSEFHRQMIDEGYFARESLDKALESLKASELKEIAEEKGLSTSGKKADLAKRIVEVGDIEYLERQFPATYSLSEKGQAFIEEHDECIQIHKHKNMLIEWDEYCRVKKSCEDKSFCGVCTKILLERATSNKRTFGSIEYLQLSKLEDEFGDPRRALRYLLQMAYISVSGVMGLDSYKSYREGMYSKKTLKSFFISNVTPIGVADKIRQHKDAYDVSIIDKLYNWKLPVMICEKELFIEIIQSIMDGTYNVQYYNAQLQVRYDRFIDSL